MEEITEQKDTNLKERFQKLKANIQSWKKTYKVICLVVLIVILLDALLAIGVVCVQNAAKIKMISVFDDSHTQFNYLDKNAKVSLIKEDGFACYGFTKEQTKKIQNYYGLNSNGAIIVRVQLLPTKKQQQLLEANLPFSLKYGFLTEEDFTSKNKFIPLKRFNTSKITVNADLRKIESLGDTLDISIALPKTEQFAQLPKGFFIYSDVKCKIKTVCFAPAQLGFDKSAEVPFFGYGSNGGVVDASFSSVDFSSAYTVFPIQNSKNKIMPEIVVTLSNAEENISNKDKSVLVKLNAGGEQIFIKNVETANQITIPSGALKNPFLLIDISENKQAVEGILLRPVEDTDEYSPIKTDPGLILKYNPQNWRNRDFEVYEWDRFPGILFFDTRNYDIQGYFFSRMAYFVEKEGYKGRILTNEELNGKHGYNAHDYSAESMANFFNAADEKGITLNKEEEILRKILLKKGLLIADGNKVKAGKGGLVSISQESAEYLRTQLLAHEGWHTLFFADEEFRNFVAAVYYTMDSKSRDFLIDYFKSQTSLGYDTNDDYLMNNEFMAYILQNGINFVANYFVTHAKWATVQSYTKELADYIIETNGQGFEDAGIMLNDYVFDKYGIISGNIALVRR